MNELLEIQDFVQEIAQATSLALNLNVEIVDNSLLRIAGTGLSKKKIGNYFRKEGVVNRFIFHKNLNKVIISSPGKDERCSKCDLYGKCDTTAAVYAAIIIDNETVGAIGLLAHNNDQSKIIDENNKVMLDFVNSMATLMSSKVLENKMIVELRSSLKFNNIIMDSIDKGILIIDNASTIKEVNDYMLDKLNMNKIDLINKPIHQFFENFDLESIEEIDDFETINELDYNFHGRHLKLFYRFKPIAVDNDITRIVLIIDDEKDIFKMAKQISNKEITFKDIISSDLNFINFKNTAKEISSYESTMLLVGETGTGKDLFAQAIHNNSIRKSKPFITVDCGAIPESLIESELFGYEKGAFTGASNQGKKGKFYLANGGSIFLDELENMPLYLQQKILRVLEEQTIEPLGGTNTIQVDVRVISATNKDLAGLVKEGKFREDLYHRLNVIPLNIPPLRDRGNDVIILSNYFIEKYNNKFNKNIIGLTEKVEEIFRRHDWKGNIRELQNAIEYSVTLCKKDYIQIEDLPIHIKGSTGLVQGTTLKEVEKKHIEKALDKFGLSEKGKLEAAKYLGISRATIYRKIKEFNIA
ncbi:MAG TPA: sigma 54-interacting transcriptional regulator [Tissierellales bacterium]|nr:sigma 54-interacting transcriptional regulator [Tissierellales bacterium]